jgi:cytochrome c oxidase subunit 2
LRPLPVIAALILLTGCSGVQSTLDPAGSEAIAVFQLLMTMVIGGTIIWFAVIGVTIYASRSRRQVWPISKAVRVIGWGGVAFPVVVLILLLSYAVWLMPSIRPWIPRQTSENERIEVTGEQFWWRIKYPDTDELPGFDTANELRLPVGQRTYFSLEAPDVIHSFWIPALGGKTDMIPGRTNVTSLQPTRIGVFRAPCAEFCGTSHALMAFSVVVMGQEDYAAWRNLRAQDAASTAQPGYRLFMRHGCSACHAIQGTEAKGRIGPDLTYFGHRQTVAAGTLTNTSANIAHFIKAPENIKPGAKMPAFGMLPDADVDAIAAYLWGLK